MQCTSLHCKAINMWLEENVFRDDEVKTILAIIARNEEIHNGTNVGLKSMNPVIPHCYAA